ncbi:MAG: hypothetical protein ED557_14920 [Balneola sp.]|nr:MAG: hypothetical protein ED557_14920 [Balneola sp.]
MKRTIEVITYHGWGMNAQFWDKWDGLFKDHVEFKKNDRGYFNEPVKQHFKHKEAVRVLFVQGFGMHWVSKADWKNAHLIVLFSTFNNLKEIMSKSRTVDHVVQQLQEDIDHKPYHTLDLFWKAMFKSGEKMITMDDYDIRDKELLKNDLEAYYHNLVSNVPIKANAKVILYETQYDDISIFSQVEQMKSLFGRLNYYHSFDIVGHAFPFSHAEKCYEELAGHLDIFD